MSSKRPANTLLASLARPLAAVGKLISGGDKPAAETITLPRAVTEPDSLLDDSFTLALEGLLTEGTSPDQIKLQLISLVEFHEAVGTKWPRIRDKVMLIAEGVINLHLGAGNVFGRQGEDFFVLLFRTVPAAEARRRAVTIAQALGTRLLGDQFDPGNRPLALAAEISLEDALGLGGTLDPDKLAGAIGEVRAVLAPAEDPRPPLQAPEEAKPRKTGDPGWMTLESNGPSRAAEPNWRAMDKDGVLARSDFDLPPAMPSDAALSLLWRPSWVAAGEVIGAYKAQIQRVDRLGDTPLEGCRAYPADGGETALVLDRFATGALVRALRAAEEAGTRSMAILPLHWATINSPKRMAALAALADLPETIRANRLVFDLFGLPDDLPVSELNAVVQSLRPLCRDLFLRVPLSHPRVERATRCGVKVVGIDLSELPPSQYTDDSHLLRTLADLRSETDAAGLGVYAWGIRRRAVVMGTVHGGFAMINGPGLMKDLERPAKVLPAPRARFGK